MAEATIPRLEPGDPDAGNEWVGAGWWSGTQADGTWWKRDHATLVVEPIWWPAMADLAAQWRARITPPCAAAVEAAIRLWRVQEQVNGVQHPAYYYAVGAVVLRGPDWAWTLAISSPTAASPGQALAAALVDCTVRPACVVEAQGVEPGGRGRNQRMVARAQRVWETVPPVVRAQVRGVAVPYATRAGRGGRRETTARWIWDKAGVR